MVDIHSHILPGLDDGPAALEESIVMVRMAAADGTTDIVATPHANDEFSYSEDVVINRIRELDDASEHIIRIHRGCDFHLSLRNVFDALSHPDRYTINGKSYLLVEFPDGPLTGMKRVLMMLLDRGLIPIMTHPERHADLRRIPKEFVEWVEMGCLAQITAQSLLGRFGRQSRRSAWEMVRRDVAHVVASDGHDVQDRPPRLDLAFRTLSARAGESKANLLFVENPTAVIAGRRIWMEPPRQKPWYHFF